MFSQAGTLEHSFRSWANVSQSERLQEHRWGKGLFGPDATIPLAAESVLARVAIHKYILPTKQL